MMFWTSSLEGLFMSPSHDFVAIGFCTKTVVGHAFTEVLPVFFPLVKV